MKKIFPLIFMPLISLFSLSAQITQTDADSIVKKRMSNETLDFTIFAKEDVQTGFEIATSTGEILELDYPCWVYYVNFIDVTNGKYLIVKESNGNLLEINTKNDTIPNGLEEWRLVSPALKGTTWRLVGIVDVQAGTLTKLEPDDCEKCFTLWFETSSNPYWLFLAHAVEMPTWSNCPTISYISSTIHFTPSYPCGLYRFAADDIFDGEIFLEIIFLGRGIFAQNFTSSLHQKIDISNLNSGIYFVKVATEQGKIVKKIVKQLKT